MTSAALVHNEKDSIVRYALQRPQELHAELSQRSLRHFIKNSWKIIEPSTTFKNNWHIDAICDHLEAVIRGQIKHLLINVPPRTCKSSTISVAFPVWAWLPECDFEGDSQRGPGLKLLFTSYAEALAVDLAVSSRRLIQSSWFQKHFGHHFQLTGDVNRKSQYENDKRGYRISLGVDGGATGKGGDILIFDDPHNIKKVESEVDRKNTKTWYTEVMSSRLNDEATGHRIMVMQRSHQGDLSGLLLERSNADGFEHLMLPMEYEGQCIVDMAHRCSQPTGNRQGIEDDFDNVDNSNVIKLAPTSLGFRDPRKKQGELLHSERFPLEIVDSLKMMGNYAYSSQYQQRPASRKGNFFKVEHFDIWPEIYEDEVVQRWRAWDKAATEDGGCYTAGVRMGILAYFANDKDEKEKKKTYKYFIDDVVRGQWSSGKREATMLQTAKLDKSSCGNVRISIEQEPAAGGKESAEASKRRLAGFTVYLDNVSTEGSKEQRADPYSVAVEMDQVVLLEAPWNYDFVEEHRYFPKGDYKDQVDAAAQAFARLSRQVRVHVG